MHTEALAVEPESAPRAGGTIRLRLLALFFWSWALFGAAVVLPRWLEIRELLPPREFASALVRFILLGGSALITGALLWRRKRSGGIAALIFFGYLMVSTIVKETVPMAVFVGLGISFTLLVTGWKGLE